MIGIHCQIKHNVMGHCKIHPFFRFLNNCKIGYTCFWLVTIKMYLDTHGTSSILSINDIELSMPDYWSSIVG